MGWRKGAVGTADVVGPMEVVRRGFEQEIAEWDMGRREWLG